MTLVFTSTEPKLHGLVGAQFGDLDFDVGKSVRWSMFFHDDTYIVDINTGEQRYWVVNWAQSFPEAEHIVTGRNFFVSPAEWRQEQFAAGDRQFHYGNEDWVLIVDGHEGLSVDNRSLPDDYVASPFKSFVYREVQRALLASSEIAYLPFFVYLKYSDLQNVTYATQADVGGQALGIPPVQQAISVPWYLPYQALPRLIKVSALRDPSFDWASIDQPVDAPDPNVKLQVISYGYAHWNIQDIPPGETRVPALEESNDDGYRMRNLLSRIRPAPDVPFGTPWQSQSTDPASLPGPWCVDTTSSSDPDLASTVEESGHTLAHADTSGIRVPLYDTVMRLNLRDGLWYEHGVSGNVPLVWDSQNQVWAPSFNPDEWPDKGTYSQRLTLPLPSRLALRLDGTPGTYISTDDANYFDNPDAFTIVAVVSLDSWHPTERKYIISKWAPPDQCSFFWALEPGGGMVLGISQDGTDGSIVEFPLNLSDGPAFDVPDGTTMAMAVSYTTTIDNIDFVNYWLCPSYDLITWEAVGTTVTKPNPGNLDIFASTTEIEIGAYAEATGNLAGYYRWLSIRQGVADRDLAPYVGGTEVGLMRGDVTSNPSYDRYGNLWVAHGDYSYTDLPVTVVENPPGSGLYEFNPPLVEDPPGSGLYLLPLGMIEDPPGSGLYTFPGGF